MSDDPHDSQIQVPASFVALYLALGRQRPTASRQEIAARYEFCEDLATLLVDTASTRLWELGIAPTDVLERIHRGLLAGDAGVNASEAGWVVRRLAELVGWEVDWDGLAWFGTVARGADLGSDSEGG